jgi:hypothetical protein
MLLQASDYRKEDQPPAHASRRIKCIYPDCFRYFSTEKEMKTHKKKEPSQYIERDEYKVITQKVFERRPAEGAIAKDAWAA